MRGGPAARARQAGAAAGRRRWRSTVRVEGHASKWTSLGLLTEIILSVKSINFKMPLGIVGHDRSYDFGLDTNDLVHLLTMKDLDIGWVDTAILYMHTLCGEQGKADKYGFLTPTFLIKGVADPDYMQAYVGFKITVTKLPCYLIPIIDEFSCFQVGAALGPGLCCGHFVEN